MYYKHGNFFLKTFLVKLPSLWSHLSMSGRSIHIYNLKYYNYEKEEWREGEREGGGGNYKEGRKGVRDVGREECREVGREGGRTGILAICTGTFDCAHAQGYTN